MGETAWSLFMNDIVIRPMTAEDIDAVLIIEQSSFSSPWSREAFQAEVCDNDLAHYLVMESKKKIIGYGGMWIIIDEAHVTNIAILPNCRGNGFGKLLLTELIKMAKVKGAHKMTLEVRVSNVAARRLYSGFEFKECGLRRGYYTDNNEDAIIMWRQSV